MGHYPIHEPFPMEVAKKHRVVQLTVSAIGLVVFVVFLLAIVVSFDFENDSYATGAARVGLLIFSAVITILTVFYIAGQAVLELCIKQENRTQKFWLRLDAIINERKWSKNKYIAPFALVVLNLFALVTTLFMFLNVPFLVWISSTEAGVVGPSIALKTLDAVGLGLQVLFVSSLVVCLWWPYIMLSGCLLAVFSTLQFLITIAAILINYAVGAPVQKDEDLLKHSQIYVCLSIFLAIAGFLGVSIIIVVRAHNRLSYLTNRLGWYYMAVCMLSGILCVVWLVHSLVTVGKFAYESRFQDGLIANPILAFTGLVLDIACIVCVIMTRSTPHTKLKVEEYNLASLSLDQLQQWALLIDAYNAKMSPDVPKGKNALELMMAYCASPMPNFTCKVLRIYDEKVADDENARSYEHVRAWNAFDDVNVFDDTSSAMTLIEKSPQKGGGKPDEKVDGKPMSKNALKRAQKKAAKKNKRVTMDFSDEKTLEELEKEKAFRAELLATEAIVLLTEVNNYDLIGALKGKFGYKLLQKTLGSESFFKPLCVRMGILGTHWPFRQMVFYTAPTKKPTARNAAILATVSRWNESRPCKDRCTLIYNPAYASSQNDAALEMSNWIKAKSLPSHVIDLRPHRGKTVNEYLKAIKYRNQASAFKQANGEVIETTDFSLENCTHAIELWKNIATKRTSEGHTAVLHDPGVDFLHSLGGEQNNERGWRKLLFLKVGDDIIASCILFFLGNTITSDIQGLDHDKARTYKAYFVMMQETIKIALRDEIPFVDFGPTTAKPKMDIGCHEVPMLGGIKCKQPLSTFVSLAANQVDGG